MTARRWISSSSMEGELNYSGPTICMLHTCIVDDSIQTPSKQLHALLDELLAALILQLSSSL